MDGRVDFPRFLEGGGRGETTNPRVPYMSAPGSGVPPQAMDFKFPLTLNHRIAFSANCYRVLRVKFSRSVLIGSESAESICHLNSENVSNSIRRDAFCSFDERLLHYTYPLPPMCTIVPGEREEGQMEREGKRKISGVYPSLNIPIVPPLDQRTRGPQETCRDADSPQCPGVLSRGRGLGRDSR